MLKILLALVFVAIAPVVFAENFSLANFVPTALNGAQGNFNLPDNALHLNSSGTNGIFVVHQPFSWNGEINARIRRSSPTVKIGLMFLQNSNSISPSAGMFLSANNTTFERHLNAAEPPSITTLTNETVQWLRVVREGPSFNGFYSNDGSNWTQLSADTIEMPNQILAGFAITGIGEATVDNVQITSAHLASPRENATFIVPTSISLKADFFGEQPRQVEFFSDSTKLGEKTATPYEFAWTNALAGSHSLFAKITGNLGAEFFTEPVNCEIELPVTEVKFIRADETSGGNWIGNYGKEGFCIVENATNYPAYADVQPIGHKSVALIYTNDPGALQTADGKSRIAAQWFTYTNMTIKIALRDGRSHQVALYCHDWDGNLRVQQVEVIDPATGKLLDTHRALKFHGGIYFVWNIRGEVQLRIKRIAEGPTAVCGLFFDADAK